MFSKEEERISTTAEPGLRPWPAVEMLNAASQHKAKGACSSAGRIESELAMSGYETGANAETIRSERKVKGHPSRPNINLKR
jgi:hypothetical protein